METSGRTVRDAGGRIREIHTDSRDVSDRVRADADREALARITAAVAGGAELAEVAGLVALQAAVVTGREGAAVVRRHGDEGIVVGAAGPSLRVGDVLSLPVDGPSTARAAIAIEGAPWGLVAARGERGRPRPGDETSARLRPLADLMSLAVANARTHERLVALATTDPLTSLANRRSFRDRLEAECARSVRAGAPLGLALVDLDHFKRVNDTHGHQAGDAVLRELALRLRRSARREDVVARVGGEEFAWLLPEADLDAAMEAAERLRRRIAEEPFPIVGRITASIGVATLDAGPDELVRDADRALYRAKDAGRDLCVAWTVADRLMEARSG
jgi:diguanylate cyclase (GGDEF)-like protein